MSNQAFIDSVYARYLVFIFYKMYILYNNVKSRSRRSSPRDENCPRRTANRRR